MKPAPAIPSVFLKSGEYYLGNRPARVMTVLGSCIAVSMYHRRSGLAALCHALSPHCGSPGECIRGCTRGAHFVRCMVPAMARAFRSRGIDPADAEVKLFGGASMISDPTIDTGALTSIGAMNVATAREIIEALGLVLKSSAVGGRRGRKIIFDTATGDVLLKRLANDWSSGAADVSAERTIRRRRTDEKN